jgi:DnaD/phage-associated family protein
MKTIGIHRENNLKYTMVPDLFIEKYMISASGEFVKVYLLLLKGLPNEEEVSVSSLADILQCTDNDILRAFNYWSDQGILQLTYEDGELSSVTVVDLSNYVQNKTVETPIQKPTTFILPTKEVVKKRVQSCEDEEFSELMYLIQQYLGAPIGPSDCDKIANLYENLGMSAQLIEFVVEYCIGNGHRNIRYMETVAIDWHKRKIETIEQAKEYVGVGRKDVYAVMKAFGLQNRQPASGEQGYIDRWYGEYGLSKELVVEACDRTMDAIHQPHFSYTDRILEQWKAANVKNMADVERLDEERRKKIEEEKKKAAKEKEEREAAKVRNQPSTKAEVAKTRFHNFEQRDTDYDAILKKINGSYY